MIALQYPGAVIGAAVGLLLGIGFLVKFLMDLRWAGRQQDKERGIDICQQVGSNFWLGFAAGAVTAFFAVVVILVICLIV